MVDKECTATGSVGGGSFHSSYTSSHFTLGQSVNKEKKGQKSYTHGFLDTLRFWNMAEISVQNGEKKKYTVSTA